MVVFNKMVVCGICFFAMMPLMIQALINHVEPLNWWVGMKNPEVQLLINGNKFATGEPEDARHSREISRLYLWLVFKVIRLIWIIRNGLDNLTC